MPGTVFKGDRRNISCHADNLKKTPESMNLVFEGRQIHTDMFVYDSNFEKASFSARIVTDLSFTKTACHQTINCILNITEKQSMNSSTSYDVMGKCIQLDMTKIGLSLKQEKFSCEIVFTGNRPVLK